MTPFVISKIISPQQDINDKGNSVGVTVGVVVLVWVGVGVEVLVLVGV